MLPTSALILSLPAASLLFLLSCGSGLLLAHLYAALSTISGYGLTAAAAFTHTVLGLGVVYWLKSSSRRPRPVQRQAQGLLFYAPALGVLTCSILAQQGDLSLLLQQALGELRAPSLPTQAGRETADQRAYLLSLQLLWIPIVEEWVFRIGLTKAFQQLSKQRLWASYFSALTFSWLHSIPTYDRILTGSSGFYLGPFLLACCCEGLYAGSGRILPAIALHAACNASVMIFTLGDKRPLAAWLLALLSS